MRRVGGILQLSLITLRHRANSGVIYVLKWAFAVIRAFSEHCLLLAIPSVYNGIHFVLK